jgi:hypothetical protein
MGMGFSLDEYAELRPYLYHTSPATNAMRILQSGRIEATADLLKQGGRSDLIRMRRDQDVVLQIDQQSIIIRDQAPLNRANIAFEAGWGLDDLVEYVNRRVFFWPGSLSGPIEYGSNHFARYAAERPIVFRVKLQSLLGANPGLMPQFSRYNTGAARQNQGKPIPRGPQTFAVAGRFKSSRAEVKEVAFSAAVQLPLDAEQASGLHGPWRRPFERAGL